MKNGKYRNKKIRALPEAAKPLCSFRADPAERNGSDDTSTRTPSAESASLSSTWVGALLPLAEPAAQRAPPQNPHGVIYSRACCPKR